MMNLVGRLRSCRGCLLWVRPVTMSASLPASVFIKGPAILLLWGAQDGVRRMQAAPGDRSGRDGFSGGSDSYGVWCGVRV